MLLATPAPEAPVFLSATSPESTMPKRLVLTEADLASRWAMSPKTLQRWRMAGNRPTYLKLGKRVSERAMGGNQLVRILDQLATTRGLPKAIRTDNGKEFCGRVMLNWAHSKGVQLFLIEPGKLNQNAYIESFNGRFRDECLNEHWFTSMAHARVVVEAWRQEYSDPRNSWAD